MHIAAPAEGPLDHLGHQPGLGPGDRVQAQAAPKKPRGTAFIGHQVRDLVTDNGLMRLTDRREREAIGGGPIEAEEDLALDLEQLPQQRHRPSGPRIVPISGHMPSIGPSQRPRGTRAQPGIIVAGKLTKFPRIRRSRWHAPQHLESAGWVPVKCAIASS